MNIWVHMVIVLGVVGAVVLSAAPVRTKNEAASVARDQKAKSVAIIAAISTNASFSAYTNIVALLNATTKWDEARPLLIKYIQVQQGLQNAADIQAGKPEKKTQ